MVFELLVGGQLKILVGLIVVGLGFDLGRGLLLQNLGTIVIRLLLLILTRDYSGVFY
jgi:hypothetical protein